MSHLGHRGWGRLPSSSIITVSQTFLCREFILVAFHVDARPLHPLTRNSNSPPAVGKYILYICGAGVSQFCLPTTYFPCCVGRCTASNPTTIYSPQPKHFTLTLCLYRYVSPSTVICQSYAASDWVPAAWKGRHTIPTVLPTFVRSPTLSNILVRVPNAPCSHSGSVDATSPSYA